MTALVSGGFTVFAERVAAQLGFDRVVANRLDLVQGRIAGTVQQPIVTGETKREALLALAAENGIAPAQTMAVGDGANDLPMLAAAGMGVAFHAKPAGRRDCALAHRSCRPDWSALRPRLSAETRFVGLRLRRRAPERRRVSALVEAQAR